MVIPYLDVPNPLDGQIHVEDMFPESANDKRSMQETGIMPADIFAPETDDYEYVLFIIN